MEQDSADHAADWASEEEMSKHEVVPLVDGRLAGKFAVVSPDAEGVLVIRDIKETQGDAEQRAAALNAEKDGPQ